MYTSSRQGGTILKKALSLFIACFIIINAFAVVQAESASILRLSGLGIMQGDENGDFNENNGVTRAEFCTMIARLRQVDGIGAGMSPVFSDVSESHWGYNAIMIMHNMGIINGRSDTIFDPDAGVTFNEAVKMLVAALGYSSVADEEGEYPQGELKVASSIGLFKGVTPVTGEITRSTAADLINAALDIAPLMKVTGKDEYEKNNATLYEILVNGDDVIKIEGILTATDKVTVEDNFDEDLEEGYIKIDDSENKSKYGEYGGLSYKTCNDYSEYLGMLVTGYARYNEEDDIYNIVSLSLDEDNTIITGNPRDFIMHSNYIEYFENNKIRKMNFASDVTFIYNGRKISSPTLEEMTINYGQYRIVENNGDRLADIVFIDEAESFIVEKTVNNEIASAIYFANKSTYRNSNRFYFDFDDENIYDIKSVDGEELSFEDIKEGQSITFIESKDRKYVKIILYDETVHGKVDSFTYDDGNIASLILDDGTEYKFALSTDGTSNVGVEIGDECTFVLDCYGNIVGVSGEIPTSYEYAYVLAAKKDEGLSEIIRLKLLQGMQPTIEETVEDGTTDYTYYFQNDLISVYECSEKVKFKAQVAERYNPVTQSMESHLASIDEFDVLGSYETVTLSEINMTIEDMAGKLIGFTKNKDGQISEIYLHDLPADSSELGNASFNAKNISFGGAGIASTQRRGYLMNPQTMYICVPNVLTSDEDCYIQIAVGHNTGSHNVYGARISFAPVQENLSLEEQRNLLYSQPVDVVILKKDMDSSNPPNISDSADVCMVTNASSAMAISDMDAGQAVRKIEMLCGDEVITEYTKSDGQAYNIALSLLPGDLVRYNKDAFGRISKLEHVGRVQGLEDTYYLDTNIIYGLAENVEYDFFDYTQNIMVNKLTLNLGDDGVQNFNIPVENGPQVYMYERDRSGWIYPADMEKILTSSQSGDASKIYAYRTDGGDIKAIVIIQ